MRKSVTLRVVFDKSLTFRNILKENFRRLAVALIFLNVASLIYVQKISVIFIKPLFVVILNFALLFGNLFVRWFLMQLNQSKDLLIALCILLDNFNILIALGI